MKLFNFKRTSFVLVLSACALGVLGTTANVAVYADEQSQNADEQVKIERPQSLDELFADPLFTIEADVADQDVLDAAEQLSRKFESFNFDVVKDADVFERTRSSNKEVRAKAKEEKKQIKIEQDENRAKFRAKFSEVFASRLKSILDDDERACSGDPTLNAALRFYFQTITSPDELAAIRARELERYAQKIQNSDNDDAKRLAFDRLYSIDDVYLHFQGSWVNQFDITREAFIGLDWDSANLLRQRSKRTEESYKSIVECGNKIANELSNDPLLLLFANQVYTSMLGCDREDEALEFRARIKKVVETFASETIEKWKLGGVERRYPYEYLSILKENEEFDESVFDIPNNETAKFYRERHDELVELYKNIGFMAITRSKKQELRAKTAIALSKASMRLDKMERSFKSEPACDFVKVQNALLTPDTANYFQAAVKDEFAYFNPDKVLIVGNAAIENCYQFAAAAHVAMESAKLDEAVLSGDEQKIADACRIYASSANCLSGYADRFLLDAQYYVLTNREVAAQLLAQACERAKGNGKLAPMAEKLNELKEALDEQE